MQLLMAILAVLIGLAFAFGGWRFFLLLLPLWGFVVGFSLGTEAHASPVRRRDVRDRHELGGGLRHRRSCSPCSRICTTTSRSRSSPARSAMRSARASGGLIGNEQGVIAFVIGLVVGVIFAAVALALNVPRYLVIVLTGLGGAAAVVAGWFILIGKVPSDNVTWWQVGQLIKDSWFYLIVWALIGAAGILAQLRGPAMGPDTYQLEQTSYRY